ncbi:succinate dehydrogenase [Aureibaculum marinum]|uniref:Succinate dehydrogenase n=1 Tax=Aureibaculum marinum TaxID=2487930 RepID=A0A3N4NQA0_9FLAO|nr:succinate dehydrogenase cytochrome b subunit [Aureibaculum marinum]RPD96707.1 succinate dehydrogenase [Aureibaculum marinum]
MSGFLSSSIARKFAMALSALFLIFFLIIHLAVNITSVFSEDLFNQLSHFMGTNPMVQFALQPVLLVGVIFHFVMGFVLEIRNKSARDVKYVNYKGSANSSWMSRNMIYSGLAILAFLLIHFIDFWAPEMNYKYIEALPENPTRYYHELQEKFMPLWRVVLYVIAFVLLGLHLLHGFQSAFQSIGFNNKYTSFVKALGKWYSILIPAGFIFIALFHYFNH